MFQDKPCDEKCAGKIDTAMPGLTNCVVLEIHEEFRQLRHDVTILQRDIARAFREGKVVSWQTAHGRVRQQQPASPKEAKKVEEAYVGLRTRPDVKGIPAGVRG